MKTFVHSTVLSLLALAGAATPLAAQEWARKMFSETTYNFGTVARDAKTEHHFRIKNLYLDDIHISGVRTSCGCTSPRVTKDTLKTHEEGEIIAHFNTDRFSGQRGATLTVTIDRPYHAEVQLRVDGFIRTDVVMTPGGIEFGSLDEGAPAEKQLDVRYAGRNDWKITEVRTANPNLEAKIAETYRQAGQVGYRLSVRLKPGAAAGYLQDQVLLVSDDRRVMPVNIEGRIVPELSVNPASLAFGRLEPGQKVTKQIVIQGKRPFTISGIVCDNQQCFAFKAPSDAKRVHVIPITFTAGDDIGKVLDKILIQTDLNQTESNDGAATEVRTMAEVVPDEDATPRTKEPQDPKLSATTRRSLP
jgi:hypothetical protein